MSYNSLYIVFIVCGLFNMAEGGLDVSRTLHAKPNEAPDPDACYPMDLSRLGHAIIVNNVATEQEGTLEDVRVLKEAFRTLGFNVQVRLDLNQQGMKKIRQWIMNRENHIDCNTFLLTFIGHGNKKGDVLDKNKTRSWNIEEFIVELNDVDTLMGKPKVMVIQACRGEELVETRRKNTLSGDECMGTPFQLPDKSDLIVAYSTVQGYRAHAGDDNGSMYLQTFAKYLQEEYTKRPLDKILTMVRQHMTKYGQDHQGMLQCTEERSTLRYELRFSKYDKNNLRTSSDENDLSEDDFLDAHEDMQDAEKTLFVTGRKKQIFEDKENEMRDLKNKLTSVELENTQLQRRMTLMKAKKIFGPEVTSTTKLSLAYNGFTKQVVTSGGDVVVFGKEGNCNGDIGVFPKWLSLNSVNSVKEGMDR